MKKLLSMVAMAVMLFATSCSQEELASVADGTQVPVVFSAQLPQEIATRVYSDGKTAKTLHYAVYVSGTNQTKFQSTTSFNDALQANVELTLATGLSYDFIFWAQSDAANEVYTLDWEAKTMTVNYNKMKANDENNDAFYAYRSKLKVTGAVKEDIKLYRPFAQINLGTKDFDLAEKAGLIPDRSSMTANLPNVLSFVDGSVSGEERVTIGVNTFTTTETFPVSGYEYLEMNYVLTDTVKGLINCTFSIWEKDALAALSPAIEVSNVPVQRNYRTNIYGSLLTDPANFNVEIIPDYNTPDNNYLTEPEVLTLEEKLYRAAANGGSVVLDKEVVLPQELVVAEGKTLEIDLNGNKLETPGLIIVKGELVIGGKGMGHLNSRIHTETAGKTTINGGGIYWGRISSDGETIINDIIYNQELEGNVLVYGGSFRDDPSAFVAPGYEAVYENSRYVVKEEELSEMAKRLYEAAQNGGSVTLEEDVELPRDLVVAEGKKLEINTNGKTITVPNIIVKGELVFADRTVGYIYSPIHTEVTGKTTIDSYSVYYGKISSDGETIFKAINYDPESLEGNILVYSGYFYRFDPSAFVAEGYESYYKKDSNCYIVREKAVLTEMAKRLYEAAENGGSVTLEEDVELLQDLVVAEGKTLEIEPNGYKLYGEGCIFVKGELIFTGDAGTIYTNIHTENTGKTIIRTNEHINLDGSLYYGVYWGDIVSEGETIINTSSAILGAIEGNILIYAGRFRNVPSAEFLAEGTEVVKDDYWGDYVVRAKE